MTLGELRDAIHQLEASEGVDLDSAVGIEISGLSFELVSATVVVQSDLWEPGTVVLTGDPSEDGEADDG